MSMKGKILFLSTALAGALAAASAAHAVDDVKVYPGNICYPQFGSQAADFSYSEGIRNGASSRRDVACPIVRDNHANINGVSGVVRVRSPNGTTLQCALFSFNALGAVVASNPNSTTSTAVTPLRLVISTSTNGGTYSLFCNLPPGGLVLGYSVNEF